MLFESTLYAFLNMLTGNDKQCFDISVEKTNKIEFEMTQVC